MKRIVFYLICVSLLPVCFAGTHVSDKNVKLLQAVKDGSFADVQILLVNGANPNIKYNSSVPVLMLAANKGHTEVVKLLMDKGADVNAKHTDGRTALRQM